MPIYEYQCEKCDTVFETMQAISAKPLKTCKGLGCNDKDNGKVHRMVSASGFILKGSGWYTSDYPSEARKQGWESERNKPQVPPTRAAARARAKMHQETRPLLRHLRHLPQKKQPQNPLPKNLPREAPIQGAKSPAPNPPNNNHGG